MHKIGKNIFRKDFILLLAGATIVMGILFYVLGYKVVEGFATTKAPAARSAATAAATAWTALSNKHIAHTTEGHYEAAIKMAAAATAWTTAASTLTAASSTAAESASSIAATACNDLKLTCTAATSATTTAASTIASYLSR